MYIHIYLYTYTPVVKVPVLHRQKKTPSEYVFCEGGGGDVRAARLEEGLFGETGAGDDEALDLFKIHVSLHRRQTRDARVALRPFNPHTRLLRQVSRSSPLTVQSRRPTSLV